MWAMSPETLTAIGVGVAIAGLTLNNMRLLRTDLTAHMNHLNGRIEGMGERLARMEVGQGDLRERMAHLEGLLQGLREAITRNHAA